MPETPSPAFTPSVDVPCTGDRCPSHDLNPQELKLMHAIVDAIKGAASEGQLADGELVIVSGPRKWNGQIERALRALVIEGRSEHSFLTAEAPYDAPPEHEKLIELRIGKDRRIDIRAAAPLSAQDVNLTKPRRAAGRPIPGEVRTWNPHFYDSGERLNITRAIPSGWSLCDGTEHTPNLNGRFLRATTDLANAGQIGGKDKAEAGAHSHTLPALNDECKDGSGQKRGFTAPVGVYKGSCRPDRMDSSQRIYDAEFDHVTTEQGAHSHDLPRYVNLVTICYP